MNSILSLVVAALASSTESGPLPPPPLQDAPPTYPQWSGALALGATWTDGNSMAETFSGTINAVRRDEKDRWTFDAFANYGKTTEVDVATGDEVDDVTTNNSGANLKYDYFWSKKAYLFGNGSLKVDHEADLDLRKVAGAGVGYQWKETEKIKWGTEVGLSFVDEDFEGTSDDTDFLAARLGSNLAYQISKSAAFEQVAEVLPSLDDSEDVIAKVDNRLKLNITGKWIAQIQYVLDFDGSVPTGAAAGFDGKEETDHRVVVGIGWNFGG